MKRILETIGIIILLIILAVLSADGSPGNMRTNLTLRWSYPANELSTNLLFKFYSSTNIAQPVASWPLYATTIGTNLSLVVPVNAAEGQRYFVGTSSNWWGESFFSNVTNPPSPPPRSVVLLEIGP